MSYRTAMFAATGVFLPKSSGGGGGDSPRAYFIKEEQVGSHWVEKYTCEGEDAFVIKDKELGKTKEWYYVPTVFMRKTRATKKLMKLLDISKERARELLAW